mmetsp:Transcript_79806/g.158107  ORF Transcript_79806/g.158107 Transcript_79806/m.158107 type:complete len:92 (-) Transcript_79806:7-282(-)
MEHAVQPMLPSCLTRDVLREELWTKKQLFAFNMAIIVHDKIILLPDPQEFIETDGLWKFDTETYSLTISTCGRRSMQQSLARQHGDTTTEG